MTKYFCPCCSLPLRGNKVGDGHICEIEAWNAHECEYTVGGNYNPPGKEEPIPELAMLNRKLHELNEERKWTNKQIRHLKAKIKNVEELEHE